MVGIIRLPGANWRIYHSLPVVAVPAAVAPAAVAPAAVVPAAVVPASAAVVSRPAVSVASAPPLDVVAVPARNATNLSKTSWSGRLLGEGSHSLTVVQNVSQAAFISCRVYWPQTPTVAQIELYMSSGLMSVRAQPSAHPQTSTAVNRARIEDMWVALFRCNGVYHVTAKPSEDPRKSDISAAMYYL